MSCLKATRHFHQTDICPNTKINYIIMGKKSKGLHALSSTLVVVFHFFIQSTSIAK